jgi:hypothetical protein
MPRALSGWPTIRAEVDASTSKNRAFLGELDAEALIERNPKPVNAGRLQTT